MKKLLASLLLLAVLTGCDTFWDNQELARHTAYFIRNCSTKVKAVSQFEGTRLADGSTKNVDTITLTCEYEN